MNTVNIIHLETIYKGCDPSGIKTDPARSHVIRFCRHTSHSHGTIMSLLSPAFLNAQQLADEKVSNEPYHITILWTIDIHQKRKPENAETAIQALRYFLLNLKTPANGAIISIYHALGAYPGQATPWRHSQFWPFAERWNPQGKYVTVHKAERLMSRTRSQKTKNSEEKILPLVEKYASQYGYDIKYIDYKMKAQEIYETMRYSDYHFCYAGATYYTAAMVGIPALAWHHVDSIKYRKENIESLEGERSTHTVQENGWGMTLQVGKIRQYDWDNDIVISKPNQNQMFLDKQNEIKKAFIGMIND